MSKEESKLTLNKGTSSKHIVFVAVMGALGNVLSGLSIYLAPLIPSIPLPTFNMSLALDLSHLSTFISALVGGPIVGAATGFIGGAMAAYQFGFSQGNLINGFALFGGKALTGATAGILLSVFGFRNKDRNPALFVPFTLLAYIPEAIFTVFIMVVVLPVFYPLPPDLAWLYPTIATQIVIKALFEMVVMGVIIAALFSNRGFKDFTKRAFPK